MPGKGKPFKKGESGNKKGRPPAEWSWSGLLADLSEEKHKKTGLQYKELIAKSLINQAVKGNVPAIKEFGDRKDGRVKQNEGDRGGEDNPMHMTVTIKKL